MATANTVSRTSSGKTSKKQTFSNVNIDNNSPLTNLMLTAEMLAAPAIKADIEQKSAVPSAPEVEMPSLWGAIRNSQKFSNMVISLTCSFFVSAVFYSAAKTMMKTKFDEMFAEKLPRYNNLVYGIGSVQNIDVDRVLLRDDLNDQYFIQAEGNGSITIDVQKILDQRTADSKEVLVQNNVKNVIPKLQDDQMDGNLTNTQTLASPVRAGLAQKESAV